MVSKLATALLFVVGLINFLPVAGVFSAANLSQAYAIELVSNDLIILMRHRALLFGIVGGFIFYSLVYPQFQTAAISMAGTSMVGFLLIMSAVGGYNASISKIAVVDIIAIICLVVCVALKVVMPVKERR